MYEIGGFLVSEVNAMMLKRNIMPNFEFSSDNNISIVSTYFDSVGGISTYVKQVAFHTADAGYKVFVISPDISKSKDVVTCKIIFKNKFLQIINVYLLLKKNKSVNIQCHGTWYLQLGCVIYKYVSKLFRKKVCLVAIKHSDKLYIPFSIKTKIFQWIDNNCDAIAFASNYLRDKHINVFKFKYSPQILVATPGAPVPRYSYDNVLKIQSMIPENAHPILTYIGLFEYLGKVEGLCLLLEAVSQLKLEFPNIIIIIAGKGTYLNLINSKIRELNIENNVKILDFITNPFDLLKLSSLHCHITRQDNFPQVILEALMAEKKVVASKCGEIPNINISGLFVVDNNINAIKNEICFALRSKVIIDIDNISTKYSWIKTISVFNDLYKQSDILK